MPAATFIEAYPDTLSAAECADIIKRFEADPRSMPSRTMRGVNPNVRSGLMLDVAELPEWADIRQLIHDRTMKNIAAYIDKYRSMVNLGKSDRSFLSPPLLERITPGQGYNWHIDAGPAGTERRLISTLLYLADVEEGGVTEFPYQQVGIRPQRGLMVLFPPFWTHLHRGAEVVKGTKYNITNYLVLLPEGQRAPSDGSFG